MKSIILPSALALAMVTSAGAADTTVKLWSFLDPTREGHRSETLATTLERFEAANPDVDVETTVMQWSELGPALLRADRVGVTPDLVMIYSPLLPAQIEAGTLLPVQDKIAGLDPKVQKDLLILPVSRTADGVFGVPWESRAFGIFYRADLLEKHGLPVPQSLAELGDTAAKIAEAESIVGIVGSLDPVSSHIPLEWFMPTMLANGSPILNEDGSANFGGEGTEKALVEVKRWVDEGATALDTLLDTNDNAQRLAESGRVAFLMQGTHRVGGLREASQPGVAWTYMPFPGLTADQPVPATVQGWQLVIPAKAQNPEGAFRLVEHWVSNDIQMMQAEKSGYMPVRSGLADEPLFAQPEMAHVKTGLTHAQKAPLDFEYPKDTDALNNAIGKMLQQVITGEMEPAEAIAWAEDEFNRTRR